MILAGVILYSIVSLINDEDPHLWIWYDESFSVQTPVPSNVGIIPDSIRIHEHNPVLVVDELIGSPTPGVDVFIGKSGKSVRVANGYLNGLRSRLDSWP